MTLQGDPLIHVVCPQCYSPQSVRAPGRFEALSYLCPRCLHCWDNSAALTTTIRSFTLELT